MPKSLVEKIAEACAGLETILKEGDNGEYAYLRILDLTRQIRAKFFAAGVVIIPGAVDCSIESVPSSEPNRFYTSAKVTCNFKVTDGVSDFEGSAAGYARDLDAKCVAIAQTGAFKTFLKQLCMIFGEYDDPEQMPEEFQGYTVNVDEAERKWGSDVGQWPISRPDAISWKSAARKSGHSEKVQTVYLDAMHGVSKITDLKRCRFQVALAWALANCEEPNGEKES